MANTEKLKIFHVEGAGEDFTLKIEGEDGAKLDLLATREQLDVLIDKLDELLSEDDEGDEVD